MGYPNLYVLEKKLIQDRVGSFKQFIRMKEMNTKKKMVVLITFGMVFAAK